MDDDVYHEDDDEHDDGYDDCGGWWNMPHSAEVVSATVIICFVLFGF